MYLGYPKSHGWTLQTSINPYKVRENTLKYLFLPSPLRRDWSSSSGKSLDANVSPRNASNETHVFEYHLSCVTSCIHVHVYIYIYIYKQNLSFLKL